MTQYLNLSEGPSKYDFMSSLFRSSRHPFSVTFTFELNGITAQVEAYVSSGEREDGSGDKWLFKAHIVKLIFPDGGPLASLHRFQEISKLFKEELEKPGRGIHGYFDTRRRKGWINPGYDFPETPQG